MWFHVVSGLKCLPHCPSYQCMGYVRLAMALQSVFRIHQIFICD